MYQPRELLTLITKKEINNEFGRVFAEAFAHFFRETQNVDRIFATGICCSLFLSHIKLGFPSDKLRTYIYNVRDEHPFIEFDCKSYEPLYSRMKERDILLLNNNIEYKKTTTSKEEIFETFDFITNGQ